MCKIYLKIKNNVNSSGNFGLTIWSLLRDFKFHVCFKCNEYFITHDDTDTANLLYIFLSFFPFYSLLFTFSKFFLIVLV